MADRKLLPALRVWQGMWILMILVLLFTQGWRMVDGIAAGSSAEVVRSLVTVLWASAFPLFFIAYAAWLYRKISAASPVS